MKPISKIISVLSFSVVFILLAEKSFAQFPGMGAFRAQQNRQFINQRMNMPMTPNWQSDAGYRTVYQVTFKDSSVKEVVSFMYTDTILHKNFLLFVDKKFRKSDTIHRNQKIYMDQTLYISTVRDYQSDKEIYGIPNDTCWMFTVIGGPLTVYARSMDYLIPVGYNTNELDASAIVGIQLNDGPILPYNADNLKNMVGQNAKALELISEKKYFRAIKRYNNETLKEAKK